MKLRVLIICAAIVILAVYSSAPVLASDTTVGGALTGVSLDGGIPDQGANY